jgi:hypothetical protein
MKQAIIPRVLTVGDGDLTLSLALARPYGKQLDLVASTHLKSSQELLHTYSDAGQVLNELEDRQVPVRYGVDATQLGDIWDAILFHHPHLGPIKDEQVHAHRHYVLLAHYFHSAKPCLRPGGLVHVCLCGQQPQTWKRRLCSRTIGHRGAIATASSARSTLGDAMDIVTVGLMARAVALLILT